MKNYRIIFRYVCLLCALALLGSCALNVQDKIIFISPTGSDQNNGTIEQPFASLERARNEIRMLKNNRSVGNIVVYLREGEYTLSNTFVLGLVDAAPEGFNISYRNYQNEKVVLHSGAKISDWKKVEQNLSGLPKISQGHVWVANIPEALNRFYTLYKGDKRLPRAQTEGFVPDTDIHPRDNPDSTMDKSTLYYPPGMIKNWPNIEDVELIIIPSYPWWMNILPLASVDEDKRVARTSIMGTDYLCDMVSYCRGGEGYEKTAWIENVLEGLDSPGEWVVNTLERKIYLWPEGDSPGEDIYAPALRELIRVEGVNDAHGSNDKPVKGINFKGLIFTKADRGIWNQNDQGIQHDWEMLDKDNAMLRFRGAEDCKVDSCEFFNAGGNAIRLDLYAQNIHIVNSLFHHLGQSAVMMLGYGLGTKDVNKNNRIYNNHIHNCGEIYWHSQMITAWQSGHNYIGHNYLHHIPRKAICISGIRYHWLENEDKNQRECVSSVRWEEIGQPKNFKEMIPFLHSGSNIIEYNEIHDALEMLGDGAAINLSGGGNGNVVRYNYVYDIKALNPSSAIRTDNDQNEALIENNIICNISSAGIAPKGENTYRNNFIINACRRKNYGLVRGIGQHMGGLSGLEHIIIYNTEKDKAFYYFHRIDDYPDSTIKAIKFDNNLYYSPHFDEAKWESLADIKSKGYDRNALFADPQFEDWENGNFTLKSGSPALRMGINQIDISKVGLTNTFPKEWRQEIFD